MQFKKTLLLIFSVLMLSQTLFSQSLWRGVRLPQNDRPRIIRHPLAGSQETGTTLQFKYNPEPVKPLLRIIHRSITEANPIASAPEEIFDIGKSTMFLEELSREAANALANPAIIASETISETTIASVPVIISSNTATIGSLTEPIIASNPTTIGSTTVAISSSTELIVASAPATVGSISADFDSGDF